MKEEAIKKSNAFAEQYQLTRLEAAGKDRKYTIIPRPDPEEYRRWGFDTLPPQSEAESHINQAYWHSAPLRGLIPSGQHTIWIRGLIQIRDLQLLLCVNINNQGDTISCDPAKPRTCCFWTIWVHLKSFRKCALVPFFVITKVDCPWTHYSTTTSHEVYQAWRPSWYMHKQCPKTCHVADWSHCRCWWPRSISHKWHFMEKDIQKPYQRHGVQIRFSTCDSEPPGSIKSHHFLDSSWLRCRVERVITLQITFLIIICSFIHQMSSKLNPHDAMISSSRRGYQRMSQMQCRCCRHRRRNESSMSFFNENIDSGQDLDKTPG